MTYPKTASLASRYQYKGFWVKIFISGDFKNNCLRFYASVELPGDRGSIDSSPYLSREEAALRS
jgi:hypothetical protein